MPKAPPQTPTNKEPKRIPNTGHDNDFCGWVEGVFPDRTPPSPGTPGSVRLHGRLGNFPPFSSRLVENCPATD